MLNSVEKIIHKLIYSTALYFSVIIMVMAIIGQNAGDGVLAALPCTVLLWTLLFSFLVSVSREICEILKKRNVNTVAVYAIHFVLTYLSFLLVYIFLGGANVYLSSAFASQNKIFTVIIMSFFYIGIYAVLGLVKAVIVTFRKKKSGKNDNYQNLYTEISSEENK